MGTGYSVPYAASRLIGAVETAFSVLVMGYLLHESLPLLDTRGPEGVCVLVLGLLLGLLCLRQSLLDLFGTLHFVPEGIAVTLFGWTLRRYPAEKIGLLCGVERRSTRRRSRAPLLGVCTDTLEGLAAKGEKKLAPYYRSSIPHMKRRNGWMERFAGEYLRRRANTLLPTLLSKDILWMAWDPERLGLLRQMYPHAAWLDTTEQKKFDAQLPKEVDPQ